VERLAKQKIELQKRLKRLGSRKETPPTDQQSIPQADKGIHIYILDLGHRSR